MISHLMRLLWIKIISAQLNGASIPPVVGASPSGKNCFLLAGSKECPSQNGFMVGASASFSNTFEFDAFVKTRSTTEVDYIKLFQNDYFCPEYQGTGLKYHTTTYCSMIGSRPAAPVTCIQPDALPFVALCRDTCKETLESLRNLFRNLCTNNQSNEALFRRNATINYYENYCNSLSISNNAQNVCLDGSKQPIESVNCGFGTILEARSYCDSLNNSDNCCSSVDRTSTVAPLPYVTPDCEKQKSCSNSGNNSSNFIPTWLFYVLLAFAILTILVLLMLLARYFLKKKKVETAEKAEVSPKALVEVIANYEASLADELNLSIGDMVVISESFDDGWAFGKNLSTGLEGNLPLVCTKRLNE
jgi:hypothetical protein